MRDETSSAMRFSCLNLFAAGLLVTLPASATNLVTGNGFGFAVVSPETATVTKFYAHPYSFTQPDPRNPLTEGIETTNFLTSLGWNGAASDTSTAYLDDSHLIRIHSSQGDLLVFMPFGFSHAALIVAGTPVSPKAALALKYGHPVSSEQDLQFAAIRATLLHFNGVPESLLLIPLAPVRQAQSQRSIPAATSFVLVSLERDDDPRRVGQEFMQWASGLSSDALARREIDQLEHWRVKPNVQFASETERHLWRQSEVMLRIAQSREPNRPGRYGNGLIVASLPDGVWFTPWVRDMAWATVALIRMGHRNEARAALLAYFNARPTGKMREQTAGADYQVSVVRYFGDGSEEPFFTGEGNTNIEFDDWGEVLWVLGEYLRKYHDPGLLRSTTYRGPLYESARDYVAKPLLANTERYGDGLIVDADTSIWEEHQKDKKHFAFSTAMAIVGLKDFEEIAKQAGDTPTRTNMLKQVRLLEKGFNAAFIRDGTLHGTLEPEEKNDIDGALLAIIHFGVVTDPAVIRTTVERMQLLKVASGGYRRVRSNYTDPAIFEYWYERQEFLFVEFSLVEVDRQLKRRGEAAAIVTRIVGKAAADHDIIPEMYVALPCRLFPGSIGDPTGARPMVGYGAGEFILDILDRERLQAKQ